LLQDGFLDAGEVEGLRALIEEACRAGVGWTRSEAGATGELLATDHPELGAIQARLEAVMGLPQELEPFFRARIAEPGDAHPLHTDDYEIVGARLWMTAMLYLDEIEGGVTAFPNASPPIRVEPQPGRLFTWFNQDATGRPSRVAEHAFETVRAGRRRTLTWFVYASTEALRAAWLAAREAETRPLLGHLEQLPEAPAASGRAFYCVDDGVPPETVESLHAACIERGHTFVRVVPRDVDLLRGPLPPGSMLYTPSTSLLAERVEQQLWQPGVSSFHRRDEGPFVQTLHPLLAFARADLPVPRFVRVHRAADDALEGWVDALGGFPLVVKSGGGEGGVGTLIADSMPALRSLLDLLLAQGQHPTLLAFVPDAVHLRLVVVGDEVVTAYRNPTRPGDFRSEPSDDPADYEIELDPSHAEIAVAASHVVGYAFAGVDLLLHPSGRAYLLEANFPCYFPQAEMFGADVAGAMLDYLEA